MKKQFGVIIVAAAVAFLGAQDAQAYDFKVGHKAPGEAAVTYAHVVTQSAFCHDRSPVDVADGDPPLTYGNYVSDSTAPGCMITHVAMMQGASCCVTTSPVELKIAGGAVGWAGGTFSMMSTGVLYVCPYDNTCTY